VPLQIEAWEALTHRDDISSVKAAMARHFRGDQSMIDVEYRIHAKSGEWRWLHTIGRVVAWDAQGRATFVTGTHRDITERRRAEEMLRLLHLATDAATNAILIVDARSPDYPLVHVNRAFERITQYRIDEVIGRNCRFLQGADREQPELERLRAAIAAGSQASVLLRNYRKDGTLFWNNLQISPVRNGSGAVSHFVGIQNDVTELKEYQVELEYRATHDALTGLSNRSVLYDTLERLIAHAGRSGEKFAVLYLDLDRFKVVNDSLGHASGDELLICVADRLKACMRHADLVARLGGDEFAVVATDTASGGSAASVARKILDAIARPITVASQEIVTSASIGACVYPGDGQTAEALLKNADVAMYRAKRSGGSGICFYTEDLNRDAIERLRFESALWHALSCDEFELHYQPRVELKTQRVTSVEALIRWRHPEEGLILPHRFIPLAEETGLIAPLGMWVLRSACEQMRRWRGAGYEDLRVAVNLSARQLREPELVHSVSSILDETGLEPSCLEFEITESVAMDDPKNTQRLLNTLSDLGVALSIDDFGTGHSSLAYLKHFQIDYLKIDQSFVRGLLTDPNDANIVRSIIALGKNLQIGVIAEGVEYEQQRAFLEAEECDEMQGFLYSMPKPADELTAALCV
jgi:diguanylate cyclase (GGDEF)-like protein/PAS domain S-box-containing protein